MARCRVDGSPRSHRTNRRRGFAAPGDAPYLLAAGGLGHANLRPCHAKLRLFGFVVSFLEQSTGHSGSSSPRVATTLAGADALPGPQGQRHGPGVFHVRKADTRSGAPVAEPGHGLTRRFPHGHLTGPSVTGCPMGVAAEACGERDDHRRRGQASRGLRHTRLRSRRRRR